MTMADRARDQKILDRCTTLGLPLLKAIKLAVASDATDLYALLRVIDLDFSTYNMGRRPG